MANSIGRCGLGSVDPEVLVKTAFRSRKIRYIQRPARSVSEANPGFRYLDMSRKGIQMNLKRSVKMGAAAIAFAAPLAIGWSVTAGASAGTDIFGVHTHDVYEIDGYGYERENIGGAVTNIITDPDGNVITLDEAPAEIVELVENWEEPPPFSEIEFVIANDGGSACYILNEPESTGWDVVVEEDGFVAAARSQDGQLEVQYFGAASNLDEIEASGPGGIPLADLPGAQDMDAC